MWGVKPKLMCNRHLLGEHVEMHMFVATIAKGTSIQGYLDNKLVIPSKIKKRHDRLAKAMTARGMNHKSPLRFDGTKFEGIGTISRKANLKELARRCEACRERQRLYLLPS